MAAFLGTLPFFTAPVGLEELGRNPIAPEDGDNVQRGEGVDYSRFSNWLM
ncbi:MAG: hypothetical protein U0V70_03265 [Terriglobia bacterium]